MSVAFSPVTFGVNVALTNDTTAAISTPRITPT
jgi:hypothetical protein